MKQLLILSGKGGTGKTTVAAAFVKIADGKVFADCDVDAPNLHLVTEHTQTPLKSNYYGSQKSAIDPAKCVGCGKCMESCRFDAIQPCNDVYSIDEYACEGCGVCEIVCPVQAISMHDDVAGELMLYSQDSIFSTAQLKMGRGTSGKLVTEVKRQLPTESTEKVAIIDGSPGIGCPVIASISGVDLVLIVAEPSLSGMSDMERIIKTSAIFGTKTAVCVNKYDTCNENAEKIEQYCNENDIDFMGKIPYDKNVSKAINEGKTVADIDCDARNGIFNVFQKTMSLLAAEDRSDLK